MRYFAELAYNGTRYHGWQKQQNALSVQAVIEEAFSVILHTPVEVVGCGRTDTGVHARKYVMHFDFEGEFPEGFINRINKFLPADVAIRSVFQVPADKHARFDAVRRSYEYHIVFEKTPFENETAWYYYLGRSLDTGLLNEAAGLLLEFTAFFPFCKTHHDAQTLECSLIRSEWVRDEAAGRLVYYIAANRFLRGMVRLIVGMCIQVALGKVSLQAVREALQTQSMLTKSWSVPAQGLFLTEVEY